MSTVHSIFSAMQCAVGLHHDALIMIVISALFVVALFVITLFMIALSMVFVVVLSVVCSTEPSGLHDALSRGHYAKKLEARVKQQNESQQGCFRDFL